MRTDMGKVITERPRWGHRDPNLGTALSVRWEGPDAEYNIPVRGGGRGFLRTKMFSDLLGPAQRWTRGQVGRPWNKVYSELCGTFDRRKTTQRHVLEHICGSIGWVALHVEKHADGYWRPVGRYSHWYAPEFYVHPRTGLLCRQNRPPRGSQPPRRDPDVLPIEGTAEEFRLFGGLWFRCRWVPEENPAPGEAPQLVLRKRQVGKKELRRVRELLANREEK